MIPARIQAAADEAGWKAEVIRRCIVLTRDDFTVHLWYGRWRHTRGRAYRGNALSAIFIGQRAAIGYLTT